MLSRKIILLSILGAGVLALVGALLWFRSRRSRFTARDIAMEHIPPQVNIERSNPAWPLQVGQEIRVDVHAMSRFLPIAEIKLWVNDALTETRTSSQGGQNPWSVEFGFAVTEPGSYTLLAAAVDIGDGQGYSAPIKIEVAPNEDGPYEDWFTSSGGPIVLPSGEQPEAPAPPHPPTEQVSSASPWEEPALSWLADPALRPRPAAPDLSVGKEECVAKILILDQSTSEEGFFIYRSSPTFPAWTLVETLAGNAGEGWLSFDDQNVYGEVSYYVAAFNASGSSVSPVRSVSISPTDCPEPQEFTRLSAVEVVEMAVDAEVDRIYCYRSFDGEAWHRWPSDGFFNPGEGGDLNLQEQITTFLMQDLEGDAVERALTLSLQCWGWAGGALIPLGESYENKVDPSTVHTLNMRFDTIDMDVAIHPPGNVQPIRYSGDLGGVSGEELQPVEASEAAIPMISGGYTLFPEVCYNHIEPLPDISPDKLCAPSPGFHHGPGGPAPQPYLFWEFADHCQAGTGADCLSVEQWVAFGELPPQWGGNYMIIEDSDRDLNYLNPALRRAFAIPPLQNECDGDRVFKLQLLFDNYLGSFRSNKETIRVPCSAFQTIGSEFNVEIEFSTLTLSEVSDRWNDTTVEMYGMMAVSSDQAVGYGGQAELWDGEHWERVRLLSTYPIPQGGNPIENWGDPGKIVKLSNGTHLLHNVPLTEYHPDEVHIIRSRSVGNNKVVVPVHEGESLMLFVGLMDSDEPLNPDAVCITRTRFGPISLTDLAGQDMVYRTGAMPKAEDTNAACQVQMVIRPIGD